MLPTTLQAANNPMHRRQVPQAMTPAPAPAPGAPSRDAMHVVAVCATFLWLKQLQAGSGRGAQVWVWDARAGGPSSAWRMIPLPSRGGPCSKIRLTEAMEGVLAPVCDGSRGIRFVVTGAPA